LERITIETVESGIMTKDLAIAKGTPNEFVDTDGFLDAVAKNLEKSIK